MCSNRLQLNALKTEFIWCAPVRRRHHIPDRDVQVGHNSVHPVQSARDLGVYVDGCYDDEGTHQPRAVVVLWYSKTALSIKWSLPSQALNTLVTSLVHSRLDYCNVVFAGLPACNVQRLQSILNTAVRLVAGSSRCDHVTSLFRDRHWLPVKQRIEYKLCTIVHRCLYSDLVDLIKPSAAASARAGLRSAESMTVAVPRTLSSLGDRSFAAAGPRAWNKLPSHLRLMQSADTFRRHLKTFLFHQAFLS